MYVNVYVICSTGFQLYRIYYEAKKFVFVSQFATVLYKNAPFYEVGQGIQKLQYTAIYHVLHSSKFKLLEMTKYQHKIRSSIHP